MSKEIIVETKALKTYFKQKKGLFSKQSLDVKAVNDINLQIFEGETLGLVGESGCGKSTLGRTILNLVPATSGQVFFHGEDITNLSQKKMQPYRKKM